MDNNRSIIEETQMDVAAFPTFKNFKELSSKMIILSKITNAKIRNKPRITEA